jgi:CheY-like chemotaxis protein
MIVEDDPAHAELMTEALRRSGIVNPTVVMRDGLAAASHLARSAGVGAESADRPVLILLDLGIPGLAGLDLLVVIRQAAGPRDLPVVVLTGSAESADIDRAFDEGANAYLVKPVAFKALADTLDNLGLARAILPNPPA